MRYFGGRLLKNETVSIMEQDHMPARWHFGCRSDCLMRIAAMSTGCLPWVI